MAGMWNTKWALVSDVDVGHTRTDYNRVIASGWNAHWNAQALIAMRMPDGWNVQVVSFTSAEIERTRSDCKGDGRQVKHRVDCGF